MKYWSPHVSLSLTLAESPSGGRNPPCLLIMPGLLRSDRGASVSPLLQENGRTPAAYISGASFLSWSFIGFPRKPSYSASFLHWIFLLSYPHSITLYIFNWYLIEAIVSWSSPTPSPLQTPWISQSWTSAIIPYSEHCMSSLRQSSTLYWYCMFNVLSFSSLQRKLD